MRKLIIYIIIGAMIVAGATFFRSTFSSQIVWSVSNQGQLLLPLVVITALVDSINPCAFSILLLTSGVGVFTAPTITFEFPIIAFFL